MKQIKRLRKGCGMSQYELAKRLRVDRSTVAKWETRDIFPRGEQVVKLANLFGCTIDDLYSQPAPASGAEERG